MNYRKIVNLSVLLVFFVSFMGIHAEGVEKKKSNSLLKTNGEPTRTNFNINNISTWINNNGDSDLSPSNDSGFEFPKGSNKTVFYESGFVWGATVNGEARVGGNTYNQGILPGAVVNGVPEDPSLEHVRIYRVRKDWALGDVSSEMRTEEISEDQVRARYEQDWNEWPASFGAPYEDVDGNGSYDASIDIPGFPGADQTIWFVANDFDATTARSLYGSDPMGVELQATFWGYASQTALGNTMFRKYKIINKSFDVFDSMYVSMWSDPDLGGAGDDYAGCDVDLSLMYIYNGDGDDTQYGSIIPAGGFDFFQGPIVKGEPTDVAIFDNKERLGFTNLPMSAHYFFINSDDVYTDPDLGNYVDGTLQFHNLFRGKISATGVPFVDPTTGEQTKFTLSGDVATQTGWVDGILHGPGDRRQGMVAGPFTMAPGDTQEVVVAQIAAGGFGSVDRLGAVSLLKFYDEEAQNTYDNFFQVPPSPSAPEVVISELDQEIVLTWDENESSRNDIEGYDTLGYAFQGYVVYQFPNASASIQDAKIVATYDLIDGIGKVIGDGFNVDQGVVLPEVKKFGSDTGIKRFISIKDDLFNSNAPITNGTSYYYGIASYAVNKDLEIVPVTLESKVIVNESVPKSLLPGEDIDPDMISGSGLEVTQKSGTANASIAVQIVDPYALTGSNYELFFDEQHYFLDKDGLWKKTNFPDSVGNALNKPGDQTPSTLLPLVAIFAPNNTLDIHYGVDIQAPDYNWVDGVKITFPDGIQINSAQDAGDNHNFHPVIDGQTVTWGSPDTTGDGGFSGGEDLSVNIDFVEPTFTASYEIYDDGWSEGFMNAADPPDSTYYSLGAGTVHGTGTVTLDGQTGFQFKTEQHWNVTNTTSGELVIEDQIVIGGFDIYSGLEVGALSAPTVEGIQVELADGSYEAPINFLSTQLTSPTGASRLSNSSSASDVTIDISNYTIFGGVITSYAIDNFGAGTYDLDVLQQDYELRYTGVYDEGTVLNGVTVHQVIEGGSMATCFRMSSAGALATNPLNPNFGTAEPFMVRIPFEVWNVDDPANPYQVNLTYRDRVRAGTEDPFWAWNPNNRMYAVIVNTPYSETQTIQMDDGPDEFNALATWVLVFYANNYNAGDIVSISYANPLQLGKDVFSFSTPEIAYDATKANADVAEVNVYPNPYYGTHAAEINKYQRYVTFTHLPPRATLRIFNLAGQLVKTIQKEGPNQFQRWDLTNETALPVASGLYVVHIDMPDLGSTKILKVAIIQETQILDRF